VTFDKKLLCFIGITSLLFSGCRTAALKEAIVPFSINDTFSAAGDNHLPCKWWDSFEDPNLSCIIEQGISGNFSIRTVWDRLQQAEQTAVMAGAALYPQFDYDGSGGRIYQNIRGNETSSNYFSLQAGAAYEVDLWGRVHSVRQAAVLDAEAASENVDAAAISLSAAIARTWYRLGEAKLQEQLIAGQLAANEQMLTIIQLQFRQGLVGAANVFRQEQLVESTRGQKITIEESLVLLQHELSVLLGRQPGKWWADEPIRLITLPELPSAGIPSELLLRRPDLRRAQKAILAADYRVSAAIAEQYPQFSLTADFQTSGERINSLFDDWLTHLAANVTGPLFDAGFRRANTERARAVLSEAIHQYGQAVLTALLEVEDSLHQEYYQRQYSENLKRQLTLSQRAYERTRESYLKGQLDYIRVLESQVSMQALERNELSARRQLIEYRIELCRSLAGGWRMDRPLRADFSLQDTINRETTHGTEQPL
jgi:NodT family efflux transporter outer membrane factor (OMF) lipoprotein